MIGIPRSFFYYLYGEKWCLFFKILNIKYVVSPKTNKQIMELGNKYSTDEMCLSLKNYIGHIAYLKDKCDYILVPRIDNYGLDDQMCTNFVAAYDIVNNLFDIPILNYNVNLRNKETEQDGFIELALFLGKNKKEALKAYKECNKIYNQLQNARIKDNISNLKSSKNKILLIGHPYNVCDSFIGEPIIKILESNNVEVIYSYLFDSKMTNKKAYKYSKTLYWKYSKEIIGSIDLVNVDGIVFLSSFPCGLDSIVNELIMYKINIPYINIIIDDMSSMSGFETRIESFIDLINERKKVHENSISNDG